MNLHPTERPCWLTPDLFPFQSRFVELGGHRIHYVDEGQGPTLLLLHGNPTWSFVWRHLIAGLKDSFRCIAPDYPGFGLSSVAPGYDFLPESHKDVVRQLVEHLGLERFTLVLQDWGGPIGLGLAGEMPERVQALVLGNTWAWPVDQDPHFVRFSRMMGGAFGGFAIRNFNAFVNVMIPMGTRRRTLSRAEMRAYRAPLDTAERREASHIFPREIVGSSDYLARVQAGLAALRERPVLLTWADRDIAFRERERQRFEALFPKARAITIKGAGHYVQEDGPGEIVPAVKAWWREEVEPS